MSVQKSAINIILGTANFCQNLTSGIRTQEEASEILDIFQAHGHSEIDTARTYAFGMSKNLLGKIEHKGRGLLVSSKLCPRQPALLFQATVITFEPESLRAHLELSLKALKTDQLDIFYLHAPDREVPIEVTLEVVDKLYKAGKFKRFGISNYQAWEVAEIVLLCRMRGWIQPTVYQGVYSALQRAVEPELFPCLRKFELTFYGYSPLAGGFLTGKYNKDDDSKAYRTLYWKDAYFAAVDALCPVAEKHTLTFAEIAFRWLVHHSYLKREWGDAIVIGVSSAAQLTSNLVYLDKGPLPENVVKALDEAWAIAKPCAAKYWYGIPKV